MLTSGDTFSDQTKMENHTMIGGNFSDDYYYWGEHDAGPPLHTRIAFTSAWVFIAVAGILGNSLVIFVAFRFQKMNNVTNCFIVNLAITDIVFLAFCMPLLVVQYTLEQWFFDQIFCKLLNFISFVSVLVTVLTLVAMTIDRYIYVVRPFENLKWRKPATVLLLSILIWLVSCIFAAPFYHHYGVESSPVDSHRQCVLLSDEALQRYFRIYTVTLYYFIPLTIIIISYASLLYFIYSKENKLKTNTKHNIIRRSRKRRAVTKMVAIVTLVFALCWLPITLYIVSANVFNHKTPLLYYFKIIANSFAYLNSAINPILYAFLNRSFRNNCGSLFAKPSCSLVYGEDERRQPHRQRPQKYLPSTQADRFSYQSTNCQSAPSSQDEKKRTITMLSSKTQLSTDIMSHNEYSDVDYDELTDIECINQTPTTKKSRNDLNTLTTSL